MGYSEYVKSFTFAVYIRPLRVVLGMVPYIDRAIRIQPYLRYSYLGIHIQYYQKIKYTDVLDVGCVG